MRLGSAVVAVETTAKPFFFAHVLLLSSSFCSFVSSMVVWISVVMLLVRWNMDLDWWKLKV
ncbi:hypothetical protein A2U01_0039579, partial [Trifolium medium]|nr:hypothetical protein [Trifolium medium]